MARAATTTDSFNAVAEPRRRELLDVLRQGERPVGDLVQHLKLPQPQVSRHLKILREVGLVEVRDDGRRRYYRVNAAPLAEIHRWVNRYEEMWQERFAAVDAVLAEVTDAQA